MRAMRSLAPLSLSELDAAPFQVTASMRLDADPLAVFNELRDPSLVFALIRRSVWHTAATGGVNAERDIDVLGFGRFREHMLAWDPGERMAFTMIATTSPLIEQMAEDFHITPAGSGVRLDWHVAARLTLRGRLISPGLRLSLRAMFAQARLALQKRAGRFARATTAS
jgi:hypothetical protein